MRLLLGGIIFCLLSAVGVFIFTSKYSKQQTASKSTYKEDSSIIPSSLYSIRLRDIPSQSDRQVIVPTYHMTFSVPQELATGQELRSSIHDENNASTVVRLYKKDTKYTKDANGYDVPDNAIIFSFDNPYGIDPIFGADQFIMSTNMGPTYTMLTDTLDLTGSMLKKRVLSLYRFFDRDHKRYDNEMTNSYKGNMRMDLMTLDHLNPTIGVVYSCYDQSAKNSDLCQKTFQLLVSSLRLEEGKLKDPPPAYAERDVFAEIPFAKTNFDPEQAVQTYQDGRSVLVNLYIFDKEQELFSLGDYNTRNMKCLPDQIFYRGNSVFEIATRSQNIPYFSIYPQDPKLLKVLSTLQAGTPKGYVVSQFALCLTDDKRYIVKYNQVPEAQQMSGVSKEDIAYAKFAVIDEKWHLDQVVGIANKTAVCNRFLALTNDDILYFECRFQRQGQKDYGSNIYKIDLKKKNYSLLATCDIPFEGKHRDPKSFCYN